MPASNEASPAFVTLARILRPRGRRGEVVAEILTDFPDRLKTLGVVYLWDGKAAPRRCSVRSCWLHSGQAVFHFEGSNSISEAERFAGLEIQVPLSERLPLPAGSYYITDLIGCEVQEQGAGMVGRVRDVQVTGEGTPGAPLLIVEAAQGELLVPLAEEICLRIDTAARRIEVRLPEGLRELNRK